MSRGCLYKTTSRCWLNLRFVSARCICVRTCSSLPAFMRLFRILPILSLLFGARASSLESREPAAHPLDARDLLEVCASVNVELVVPNLLGVLTAVGIVAQLGVEISGDKVVTDILRTLYVESATMS